MNDLIFYGAQVYKAALIRTSLGRTLMPIASNIGHRRPSMYYLEVCDDSILDTLFELGVGDLTKSLHQFLLNHLV